MHWRRLSLCRHHERWFGWITHVVFSLQINVFRKEVMGRLGHAGMAMGRLLDHTGIYVSTPALAGPLLPLGILSTQVAAVFVLD
jgi:hypothetical protein